MIKFKKVFLLYSTVIGFFLSLALISPSIAQPNDIEWSIKEGDSYTWIVKSSEPDSGFPPVNSKFTINVAYIQYFAPSTKGNASRIYATITYYDPTDKTTYTNLDNSTFTFFNHTYTYSHNVSFYSANVKYHGFFAPLTYGFEYEDGLSNWFSDHGSTGSGSTLKQSGELLYFSAREGSTNFTYAWNFKNCISYRLRVHDVEDNTLYLVLLEGYTDEHAISYGIFFLIFSGVAILSLIYLYMKKIK
ncbi:MAG: hypothetical protein ACFFB0_15760 [Promethearchaeota archaeon]